MKTTLDLPATLVKRIRLRAQRDGKQLNEAVADLLRRALAAEEAALPTPVIAKDQRTGLPLIQCQRAASLEGEASPERVAAILLAQEVEWHHATGR